MKSPVFILSLFDTGYYTARQIKDLKCPILGFDFNTQNPGNYSSFINVVECPHPVDEAEKLLHLLIEKRNQFKPKPILIPASELFVFFMNQYRDILQEDFLFILPEFARLNEILNKATQLDLALETKLKIAPFLNLNLKDTNLPRIDKQYIIRAADQIKWKNNVSEKALIVSTQNELNQAVEKLRKIDISFICQQLIQGDITNNFEYNALMIEGVIIHSHIIQKLHQYPLGFGAACAVKVVENKEIDRLGSQFVLENKIEGFSNTEFKYNPEDKEYYFIETNPRVWQQIELSSVLGDNIMHRYYEFLTSQNLTPPSKNRTKNALWIDLPGMLILFFKYRKVSGVSILKLIKYLCRSKNYGLFSMKDIKPFVRTVLFKY